ncbi:hypothetical protein VTN00DRAFT_918 [Thermoascus crustaceus]|uniref:uncharacterized protein n=1 Tax=Thermoascus crustaceus TaxID=5088 RepID=UPI0037440D67
MLESTITVLGDLDTGKTAFRWKFALNNFIQADDPVVDSCSDRHLLLDGIHHQVSLVEAVPKSTSAGFLILYSVTSRTSFESVRRYYDEIIKIRRVEVEAGVEAKQARGRTAPGIGVPVVLAGNKSNLAEEKEGQREVTRAEGEALAKDLGLGF